MARYTVKSLIPTTFLLMCSSTTFADVPFVFQSQAPAKATEVNQNFAYLDARANEHESRFVLLETGLEATKINTSPILIEGLANLRSATLEQFSATYNNRAMVNEMNIDVDCSTDKYALREAYLQHAFVKELNFDITGICYGSLNTLANGFFQIMNQVLSLNGPAEAGGAGVMADPTTKRVDLLGGFGGGLYLRNIEINLGVNDFSVLFSRNSHNNLTNVVIKGVEGSDNWGIWAQAGAQFYISNTTIDSPNGIGLTGGAVMRSFGGITIQSNAMKYALISRASIARMSGTIEVKGQRDSNLDFWDGVIQIIEGSNFYSEFEGYPVLDMQIKGHLYTAHDSTLSLDRLIVDDGVIGFNHAKLNVVHLEHLAGGFYAEDMADFRIHNGEMGRDNGYWANMGHGSKVTLNNITGAGVNLNVSQDTLFSTSNSTWASLYGDLGATVNITDSVFTGEVQVHHNSAAHIWANDGALTSLGRLSIRSGSTANVVNVSVNGNVEVTENATIKIERSSADMLFAHLSTVNIYDSELNGLSGTASSIVANNTPVILEFGIYQGSNGEINNMSGSGRLMVEFNSTLNVNSSTIKNLSARFNSSLHLRDTTVTGTGSVIDWAPASILVDRNSSLAFWGTSGVGVDALPIRIEALSFAEFDYGVAQALNGVTIDQCSNSLVFIPDTANATVNTGC